MYFYIFQILIHIFKDDFTKFQYNSRTKGTYFQIRGVFQDQGKIDQACANSIRACLILYAILTPKFTLWIYVVVMECRSLFSSTSCDLDLRSQFLKKCTHSRSPILIMVAFHSVFV